MRLVTDSLPDGPLRRPAAPVLSIVLAGLLLAAAAACAAPASGPSAGAKPLVLATTTILADLARNVAGDRATVASVAPAGAGVEEYAPRPEDARRAAEARVVLVNGLDLDRWAAALLRGTKAKVVTLSDGLPTIDGNPHLWFDPQLAKAYVERIRDALVEADPEGRDGYVSRASAYAATLDALDRELRAKVATIPSARRVLVTSHDAFPYLARAYGFTIIGFAQSESGKDPSPSELADLVGKVRRAGVPAIFSEAGVSPRLAETLAREAGVRSVVTDLPTDSVLDAPADSYVGVMRVIIDKMVVALR